VAVRTILHCDLDAFYAAVEQRDDPSLAGKPVVVGGPARRGVVCAASYEARRFGVKSAMSMGEALRRCPHAVVLAPRFDRYAEVSASFFGILERYSPLVEGLSLDEGFLDVSGEERLFGDGPTIGRRIRAEVAAELRLTVSVGVADCKLVAKIASDLRKPDALVVVPAGQSAAFLAPLPVSRLWGVGPVTEASLTRLGIATIGDLTRLGPASLGRHLGDEASRLVALARGRDDRDVEPDRSPVSLGHEDTFAEDLHARPALHVHLLDQADRVAARLRAQGLRARTVTLKVKYPDFTRLSRRHTLAAATSDGDVLARVARELLAEVPDVEQRGVRLVGVSASGLEDQDGPRQLSLAAAGADMPASRGETLGATLDAIHARFGASAVRRAVHVDPGAEGADAAPSPLKGSGVVERARPRSRDSQPPADGDTSASRRPPRPRNA
jgi:DNA polymerase-4